MSEMGLGLLGYTRGLITLIYGLRGVPAINANNFRLLLNNIEGLCRNVTVMEVIPRSLRLFIDNDQSRNRSYAFTFSV